MFPSGRVRGNHPGSAARLRCTRCAQNQLILGGSLRFLGKRISTHFASRGNNPFGQGELEYAVGTEDLLSGRLMGTTFGSCYDVVRKLAQL
jgi:hypothetical protein